MTSLTNNYARLLSTNALMAARLKVGLVGYWPLEEAAGTRRDRSGLGNDLTDNNTVTGNPGPSLYIPLASQFTRANSESLSVASNGNVQTGNIEWEAAFWLYLDSTPAVGEIYMLFNKDDGGAEREYNCYVNDAAKVTVEIFSSADVNVGTLTHTTVLTAGTWYFLALGHSAADGQVRVSINNGTPQTSATTGTPGTGAAPLRLGGWSGVASYYLNGRMCQVSLWKRVLTAQERTWLYNNGAGRSLTQMLLAA